MCNEKRLLFFLFKHTIILLGKVLTVARIAQCQVTLIASGLHVRRVNEAAHEPVGAATGCEWIKIARRRAVFAFANALSECVAATRRVGAVSEANQVVLAINVSCALIVVLLIKVGAKLRQNAALFKLHIVARGRAIANANELAFHAQDIVYNLRAIQRMQTQPIFVVRSQVP